MRTLPLPTDAVLDVVESCAGSIRDPGLAWRLRVIGPQILAAQGDYFHRGGRDELYLTPVATQVDYGGVVVTQAEMAQIYSGTLSRKGSPARRAYYDALKASAPYALCPSCSQRTVSTLDHYLPKQHHPALAITPLNLVPNCADCNKTKQAYLAAEPGRQLLHPYFDSVEDGVWLHADVVPGDPPSLTFRATPPAHWPPIKQSRVQEHFRVLRLNELYVAHASRLIADIGYRLNRLRDQGGAAAVSAHLAEEADSRRQRAVNSWEIAAFTALSQSPAFCVWHHG